ncbi:MAG TPA: alpha/beta hydrolase family protein [Mycobacteriales bacterium]|nr:alpha/beta hydrolase family protein [Mycobacteriales bacterium]
MVVRRAALAISLVGTLLISTPVGALSAASDPPSAACVPRTSPVPTAPARLIQDSLVAGHGSRLHDITLRSPALDGQVHVYVLLPPHYAASHRRYHVLYLLHGSGGSAADWTTNGAERLIDRAAPGAHLPPMITVMPDGGVEGFYTDWYGTDIDQPAEQVAPGWATFDLHELVPFVDRHYRTRAGRAGRAIAGLSMGGFGATSLAARAPGTFAAVGSFSGADDIDDYYPIQNGVLAGTSPAFTDEAPDLCIWGDPTTHRIGWEAADPTYLAADLSHHRLFIATGNGRPGKFDSTAPQYAAETAAAGAVEQGIHQMNQDFVRALDAARVPHIDDFYGNGTHSWPYWRRDLTRFIPILARAWRHPDAVPTRFSDRSASTSFRAWGWHFTAHRAVAEFTYLRHVSAHGLEVSGSGTLHVVTAADYAPDSSWLVDGQRIVAGGDGKLRFTITMPSHATEQVSFPAGAALPPGWHWRHVGIQAATPNR